MKKKKIIVDFDCTLYNTNLALVSLYNTTIKYPKPNKKWDEIEKWDYSDIFDMDNRQEILDNIFKNPRLYKKENLYNELNKALKKYYDLGHDIIICSICNFPNAVNKNLFIEKYISHAIFIPIISKNVLSLHKTNIDMKDAIFLDDSYRNIEESNADNKILINFGKIPVIKTVDEKTTIAKTELETILALKNIIGY